MCGRRGGVARGSWHRRRRGRSRCKGPNGTNGRLWHLGSVGEQGLWWQKPTLSLWVLEPGLADSKNRNLSAHSASGLSPAKARGGSPLSTRPGPSAPLLPPLLQPLTPALRPPVPTPSPGPPSAALSGLLVGCALSSSRPDSEGRRFTVTLRPLPPLQPTAVPLLGPDAPGPTGHRARFFCPL